MDRLNIQLADWYKNKKKIFDKYQPEQQLVEW
jgi:hypothetical protein